AWRLRFTPSHLRQVRITVRGGGGPLLQPEAGPPPGSGPHRAGGRLSRPPAAARGRTPDSPPVPEGATGGARGRPDPPSGPPPTPSRSPGGGPGGSGARPPSPPPPAPPQTGV